jgi:hypothetical protein
MYETKHKINSNMKHLQSQKKRAMNQLKKPKSCAGKPLVAVDGGVHGCSDELAGLVHRWRGNDDVTCNSGCVHLSRDHIAKLYEACPIHKTL